jgi:hypothetical protein
MNRVVNYEIMILVIRDNINYYKTIYSIHKLLTIIAIASRS